MSGFVIVRPLPIASIAASRGSGAANLLSRNPKEAWVDTAVGSQATFSVDLGAVMSIDTVALLYVGLPAVAATWAVMGGMSSPDTYLQAPAPLRVPDVAGILAGTSHALWHGAAASVRYLTIGVTQPAGGSPLSAGVLLVGRSFRPEKGQEWGAGRRPIDTGTSTALGSGGFAAVEGARKSLFSWTFGDLSVAETDQLEVIALELGETAPGLVIEDTARTAGLRSRIHYGLFRWRQFERRNRRQTRWEISIEQWV